MKDDTIIIGKLKEGDLLDEKKLNAMIESLFTENKGKAFTVEYRGTEKDRKIIQAMLDYQE